MGAHAYERTSHDIVPVLLLASEAFSYPYKPLNMDIPAVLNIQAFTQKF